MELQDILYLVLSFIEKKELERFSSVFLDKIARPKHGIIQFLERVQRQLKTRIYSEEPKLLKEQIDLLRGKMQIEVLDRMELLPNIENFKNSIKLTARELEQTKQSIASYLEELKDIKDLDFLWGYLDVERGNFNKLASSCLEGVFGKGIFSVIESTEARTNLLASRSENFMELFSLMKKMPESLISFASMKSEIAIDISQRSSRLSLPILQLSRIAETVPLNEDTPYEYTIRIKI